jgi:hypothetical protein
MQFQSYRGMGSFPPLRANYSFLPLLPWNSSGDLKIGRPHLNVSVTLNAYVERLRMPTKRCSVFHSAGRFN